MDYNVLLTMSPSKDDEDFKFIRYISPKHAFWHAQERYKEVVDWLEEIQFPEAQYRFSGECSVNVSKDMFTGQNVSMWIPHIIGFSNSEDETLFRIKFSHFNFSELES